MCQGCGEAHAGGWPIFLSVFWRILFFYDQVLVRGRPREGQEVRPEDLRTLVQASPVLHGPDVLLPLSPGKRRTGGFRGNRQHFHRKKRPGLGLGKHHSAQQAGDNGKRRGGRGEKRAEGQKQGGMQSGAPSEPHGQHPGLPEKQEDGVGQRQLEDLIAPLRRPARLPPSQICISI